MKKLAVLISLSISSIIIYAQTTILPIHKLMENSSVHQPSTTQNRIVQINEEYRITADQFVQAKKQEWLDHPKANLLKVNSKTSTNGKVHNSYQQTWDGIPIEDQYMLAHEKNGNLESVNGALVKHLNLNTIPSVTPKQALQSILNKKTKYAWQLPALEQALQESKNDLSATWHPQGELIITSSTNISKQKPKNYQLAWRFEVYSIEPHELSAIYIDAHTTDVIKSVPLMNHSYTQGSGQTNYNGTQTFTCKDHGNHYELKNEDVNAKKFTGTFYNPGSKILSLDQNNWQGKEYAIDVLWGTEQMVAFLDDKLGRNKYDDNGGQINALTGIENVNNAFWNGSFMGFGGGDGISMQSATSIDIVAHEYAHAMLDHIIPGNGFTYAGESGAIEEAYCDIFGELLEHYVNGTADWKVGSKITLTNGAPNANGLRDLSIPRSYKDALWHDTPSDNWGVHFNSAIYSHWFYLLVNNYQVNMDTAAQLIYETLYYLHPASDYFDLWSTSIQIADSSYASIATDVKNAWEDVGFTGTTMVTTIPNIQPSNGQTVYGGFSDTISWDTTLSISFVNIEYSINGGQIWDTIALGYDYTIGHYPWSVPQNFSNTAVIRVTDVMNVLTRGISAGYFNLVNTQNIPPVANDDVVNTTQGFFEIIQPWTNDTDEDQLDSNSLSIVTTIPTNEGTLILQGNSIRINVNPGFIGSFSFDYQICDLGLPILCDTASITVNAEETPTIYWAMDDWVVLNQSASFSGNVLDNDYLQDLTWQFDGWESYNLSHGNMLSTMSGGYTYYPTSLGRDTVEYYVTNGSIRDTGHLYLFVVEDQPLANDSMNLVILYNMTNGINWTINWDLDSLVSTWHGISSSQSNVTHISLNNNQLVGSLPDLYLPNLVSLSLRENQITGAVPDFDLPGLQDLVLQDNQLFGSIPDFNNLPGLKTLDLRKNEFSGFIPNYNLPDLIKLDLTENQLTGSIPNFNFSDLTTLSLGFNNLSDSIPFFNLPSLNTIFLNQNTLTNSIPNFNTSSLPALVTMNFDDNQLSGTIPNFDLPLLKGLSLANNQLIDTIPDFNLPALLSLILSGNQLIGSIPDFTLNDLVILRLGANQLTGTIPDFNSLNSLLELRLDYNQLTGSVPDFSHVNALSLTFNLLTFSGLEQNLGISTYLYVPQKRTPIIQLGDTLKVFAGDTIADNSYHWYYENNPIPDTIIGQEYFIPGLEGNYVCWVYNENVPNLILYSDTVYLIPTCNIVTTFPDSTTMCAGDTISGNLNQQAYSWRFNGSIIGTDRQLAVYASGNYILQMRDSCQNLASDTIEITIDSNCIYPGDTNQDGIVNHRDLLNIGLHFGANGPARLDSSTGFTPLMGYDWSDSTNANINLKHVDANGDGYINKADATVVSTNYGNTWKTPVTITSDELSDIQLIPTIKSVSNNELQIAYNLTSNENIPFQYYGLAFDTRIDAPIDITGNALILDSTSLNIEEYLLISEQALPYIMESAFTQTNLQDYSLTTGSSEFGNAIGATEDDFGGGDSVSVIQISTENILVTTINSSFSTGNFNLQVSGGSTTLYYYDSTLAFTLTPTPSYCDTAGSISVDILNGSGLTYLWDSGQSGPTATGLAVGIHTVTIVSGNDSIVASAEVEGVNPIEITSSITPPTVGQNNGAITIAPTGGFGNNYNMVWNDGQTGPTANGLSFCEQYTVLVEDEGACIEAFSFDATRNIPLRVKVMLEGPYNPTNNLMHDQLRIGGQLPLTDPYNQGNVVDSSVFKIQGPNGIVDWILVELRDSISLDSVDSFALLLQRDGDIVDLDGISIPSICANQTSYFLVVKHRNHLTVGSKNAISVLPNTGLEYDFTTQLAYQPGNANYDATKLVGSTYLLWEGNTISNTDPAIINAADRSKAWNERNQSGYLQSDTNLDGVCNAGDRSTVWNNRNKISYVSE